VHDGSKLVNTGAVGFEGSYFKLDPIGLKLSKLIASVVSSLNPKRRIEETIRNDANPTLKVKNTGDNLGLLPRTPSWHRVADLIGPEQRSHFLTFQKVCRPVVKLIKMLLHHICTANRGRIVFKSSKSKFFTVGETIQRSFSASILASLPSSRTSNVKRITGKDIADVEGSKTRFQFVDSLQHRENFDRTRARNSLNFSFLLPEFEKYRRDLTKKYKIPLKSLRRVDLGPRSIAKIILCLACPFS
jgi:hypothetical protein